MLAVDFLGDLRRPGADAAGHIGRDGFTMEDSIEDRLPLLTFLGAQLEFGDQPSFRACEGRDDDSTDSVGDGVAGEDEYRTIAARSTSGPAKSPAISWAEGTIGVDSMVAFCPIEYLAGG